MSGMTILFSKLADHLSRHQAISKTACQAGYCIWPFLIFFRGWETYVVSYSLDQPFPPPPNHHPKGILWKDENSGEKKMLFALFSSKDIKMDKTMMCLRPSNFILETCSPPMIVYNSAHGLPYTICLSDQCHVLRKRSGCKKVEDL